MAPDTLYIKYLRCGVRRPTNSLDIFNYFIYQFNYIIWALYDVIEIFSQNTKKILTNLYLGYIIISTVVIVRAVY